MAMDPENLEILWDTPENIQIVRQNVRLLIWMWLQVWMQNWTM